MAKTALEIILVDQGTAAVTQQPGPPAAQPRASDVARRTEVAPASALHAPPRGDVAQPGRPPADQPAPASALDMLVESISDVIDAFASLKMEVVDLEDRLDAVEPRAQETPSSHVPTDRAPRGRNWAASAAIYLPGNSRVASAGAQASVRLASLAQSSAATSAALSSIAAAGAGVALGFAAIAAVAAAVVVSFKKMSDVLSTATGRLQDLSPELAVAVAQTEVQRLQNDIRQAEELGPRLAEFERSRMRLESDMKKVQTAALEALLDIWDLLEPTAEEVIRLMAIVAENTRGILGGVMKGAGAAAGAWAVLKWNQNRQRRRDIEEWDGKFVDDPFLRQWLGDLPKPDEPGAEPGAAPGGEGGVP